MIHGRALTGELSQEAQDYDAEGRVCIIILDMKLQSFKFGEYQFADDLQTDNLRC